MQSMHTQALDWTDPLSTRKYQLDFSVLQDPSPFDFSFLNLTKRDLKQKVGLHVWTTAVWTEQDLIGAAEKMKHVQTLDLCQTQDQAFCE